MNRPLLFKIGAILVLALALIVPLHSVGDLVAERRGLHEQVLADLARSSVGPQRVDGIALVLPCTDSWEESETLDNGRVRTHRKTRRCDVHVLPERLGVTGELDTELRRRGIYAGLVYRGRLRMEGTFQIPVVAAAAGVRRTWGSPQLVIGIADVRGIVNVPVLEWDGAKTPFAAGVGSAPWAQGIHADVAVDPARGGQASFALDLGLAGMDRLELVPSAGEVTVSLSSGWPHPSFIGRFLPESRTVTDIGFEASWHNSDLGTGVRQAFQRCVQGRCDGYLANAFGVRLIQSVDVYQRAYRAAHYGLLFVALTFALFFLYEILSGLRVHPLQYALVGFALIAFFVLLLALAEHVPFSIAYLIAAAACITLIGLYVRFVLATPARVASLVGLLGALYGALYLVLGSEDYALLMGALLLFAALAVFMLCTRKLDWYALSVQGTQSRDRARAMPT